MKAEDCQSRRYNKKNLGQAGVSEAGEGYGCMLGLDPIVHAYLCDAYKQRINVIKFQFLQCPYRHYQRMKERE